MKTLFLAAGYDRTRGKDDVETPIPLMRVGNKPLLTLLVEKVRPFCPPHDVVIVTNEDNRKEILQWRATAGVADVKLTSDGTSCREEARGAVGDIVFALKTERVDDDVLIVGGQNWFTYSLEDFVNQAKAQMAASVLVTTAIRGEKISRFGMVEVGPDRWITDFVEKPQERCLTYKASCVYFFPRSEIQWFDRFASSESTKCTPGDFLSWLVRHTRVYAIQMKGDWSNVQGGAHVAVSGPSYMQIRRILRDKMRTQAGTWERASADRFSRVGSYGDLLGLLKDDDANVRILASQVLGDIAGLLDDHATEQVVSALLEALEDPGVNSATDRQMDEDEICYVSAVAADSLVKLHYAKDVPDVVAKARQRGIEVKLP